MQGQELGDRTCTPGRDQLLSPLLDIYCGIGRSGQMQASQKADSLGKVPWVRLFIMVQTVCRGLTLSQHPILIGVDTCCIDKSSSAELSKAISSMFRWYQNADKCYVFLSDVSTSGNTADYQSLNSAWEGVFRESRWFRRGQTL